MRKSMLLSVLCILLVNNVFCQFDSASVFISKDGDFLHFSNNYAEFKRGICWGGGRIIHKTKKKFIIENDITYSGNTQSYYRIDSSHMAVDAQPKFIILDEEGNYIDERDIIIYGSSSVEKINIAVSKDGYFQFPDNNNEKQIDVAYISSAIYFPLRIRLTAESFGVYTVTLKKFTPDFSMMYLPDFYKKIKCKCINKQQIKCAFFGKHRKLLPYEVLSRIDN
jgi:hypothetical protein